VVVAVVVVVGVVVVPLSDWTACPRDIGAVVATVAPGAIPVIAVFNWSNGIPWLIDAFVAATNCPQFLNPAEACSTVMPAGSRAACSALSFDALVAVLLVVVGVSVVAAVVVVAVVPALRVAFASALAVRFAALAVVFVVFAARVSALATRVSVLAAFVVALVVCFADGLRASRYLCVYTGSR
jgi:hypothetical protein